MEVSTFDMYPLSYFHYTTALYSTVQALDNVSLSDEERRAFAEETLALIRRGDTLVEEEVLSPDFISPKMTAAFYTTGQNLRFINFLFLAMYDTNAFEDLAEIAYAKLLDSGVLTGTASNRVSGSYTAFYYAAYLATIYGEERKMEIEELLSVVVAETKSNEQSIWEFFNKSLNGPVEERGHINVDSSNAVRIR